VAEHEETRVSGESGATHPGVRRRVLVVDGDADVRSALRLLLDSEAGFEVVGESGRAESLLQSAAASRPDLVLLDWDLPGLTANGTLPLLRARFPNLLVIALSARPERCALALAAGADAFISKVEEPTYLRAALRALQAMPPGLAAE
jgi:DNA-binding NarL/FixJ family response regulator